MPTTLLRISGDIAHHAGANEAFLLAMVLKLQGESKILFFEDFMGRKETPMCAFYFSTTLDRLASNQAKHTAKGDSCLY